MAAQVVDEQGVDVAEAAGLRGVDGQFDADEQRADGQLAGPAAVGRAQQRLQLGGDTGPVDPGDGLLRPRGIGSPAVPGSSAVAASAGIGSM